MNVLSNVILVAYLRFVLDIFPNAVSVVLTDARTTFINVASVIVFSVIVMCICAVNMDRTYVAPVAVRAHSVPGAPLNDPSKK